MLWTLALLAPFSLLMSDLPSEWAWPTAVLAGTGGVADALRYRRQAPVALVIPAGHGQPTCDGRPMQAMALAWRGPLAFLRWRDVGGRARRLVFWPDTLAMASRRELRLASMRRDAPPAAASVAG